MNFTIINKFHPLKQHTGQGPRMPSQKNSKITHLYMKLRLLRKNTFKHEYKWSNTISVSLKLKLTIYLLEKELCLINCV
jgi:hypothetical protein